MRNRCVLMSVKPQFAEMIMSGEKDIELRRRNPSFLSGTRILLYSSSPQKALVGWTVVDEVHMLPKEKLWEAYGHRTGLSIGEFFSYFKDVAQACGIELSQPQFLRTPIALEDLREYFPRFRPPQSYQFVQYDSPLADALRFCSREIDLSL
jgi:predicted transcriptional regulator